MEAFGEPRGMFRADVVVSALRATSRARAFLTSFLVVALGTAPIASQAQGPAIVGITFDWSSYRDLAPGSDNWPLTWCEDDHQYTSWGDGGGFGGSNTQGRVSLGFARVEGAYDGFNTTNLWGGFEPVAAAGFSGKVISLLCVGGDLYAWHSPSSETSAFQWQQLVLSEDKGTTWQENAFPGSRLDGCAGCPGLPYSINYGRNYAANADGYVYTFWIEIQDPTLWNVQVPGTLWLMRAPVAGVAFADAATWEWVTGFAANGDPVWGSQAGRVPVLEDPEGLMRGNAIYVPGLDRFLMATNHSGVGAGNVAIWEAPEPWGPWTSVRREYDWPEGDPAAPVGANYSFGSFSPKWFSTDGRSFVFFRPDGWNSVTFTLDTEGPAAVPALSLRAAPALAAGLLALAWRLRRERRA